MDKKPVIFVIALFIAILFLAAIGPVFTGYLVLDQSEITLKDYPYPFIKNSGYNGLYIVLPENYNPNEYSAAIRVAENLQTTQLLLPKIVTDKTLPEGEYNLIIIGNPCNNEIMASELNTNSCYLVSRDQGLIQLVNHERTSSLILSGDSYKAARALAGSLYPLLGTRIVVSGEKSLTLHYG